MAALLANAGATEVEPANLPTSVYETTLDRVELVTQLVNNGYAVIDGFLADLHHDLPALLAEARRAAGVTRGNSNDDGNTASLGVDRARCGVVTETDQDKSIRRDLTHDVDPLDVTKLPLLAKAARTLQFLVGGAVDLFMPQKLYSRERPQFACYPGGGSFYRRHFDNPRNLADGIDNLRRITILLYLNEDWPAEQEGSSSTQGGELRLLLRSPEYFEVNVAPIANRCVVFFSDLIEHEVLPTSLQRIAMTVWLSEFAEKNEDEMENLMRKYFLMRSRQVMEEHDARKR